MSNVGLATALMVLVAIDTEGGRAILENNLQPEDCFPLMFGLANEFPAYEFRCEAQDTPPEAPAPEPRDARPTELVADMQADLAALRNLRNGWWAD